MKKLKVSVIVPTYRRESEMIKRALESIIDAGLSKHEFEIIVIDDNAEHLDYRKNNNALVNAMKNNDPNLNIKLIENKVNQGGSICRNNGVQNAIGEYLTFLDDDDIYLKSKLYEQYNFINGNFDMIFSNLLISNGEKIIDKRTYEVDLNVNKSILKYHLMHHITGTPTFMIKRDLFNEIGGFPNVKMGQEFHLMYNIIVNKLKIGYLNKDLVIAFAHDGPRISAGKNKIDGENKLFRFKKQHIDLFTKNEWNYIKMRHYAVLAYYSLKSKDYGAFLLNSLKSFSASPINFIIELKKRGK